MFIIGNQVNKQSNGERGHQRCRYFTHILSALLIIALYYYIISFRGLEVSLLSKNEVFLVFQCIKDDNNS